MELNYDVLNYLNFVGERFGEMYMKRNFNPMPSGFCFTDDNLLERINFKAMQKEVALPSFMYENKKGIYKNYKTSLKNTRKIEKMLNSDKISVKFNSSFKQKLKQYLVFRIEFLKEDSRNFNNTSFFEFKSYGELIGIDPVFAEIFIDTFSKDFDISEFLITLEERYQKTYEKLEQKAKLKDKSRLESMYENMNIEPIKAQKIQRTTTKVRESSKKIEEIGNLEKIEKESRVRETYGESETSKPKPVVLKTTKEYIKDFLGINKRTRSKTQLESTKQTSRKKKNTD